MGTDIHLILEVQDSKTNKWYRPEWDKVKSKYYDTPASILDDCLDDRNYSLFFALTGQRYWRSDEEAPIPLWPDRGLPVDTSLTVKPGGYGYVEEHILGDHSYSYFTAEEWRQAEVNGQLAPIKEVAPWFYGYVSALFGDNYAGSSHRWQGIQNMRILVGYDS